MDKRYIFGVVDDISIIYFISADAFRLSPDEDFGLEWKNFFYYDYFVFCSRT